MAPARTHTCGGCGRTAPWSEGWRWPHVPGFYLDPRVLMAACCAACEATILAKGAA